MGLSQKATRFVLEALDHYQRHLDQRLQQEGLGEDEASDLANDREYLEAIKQELRKYQDEQAHQREAVRTEG